MPGRPPLPTLPDMFSDKGAGWLSRREFLTLATATGVMAAARPRALRAQTSGTLRIAMPVVPLKDPRLWDRMEMANFGRGWLEYLVELQPDGTIVGMLLESWDLSAEATTLTLRVRPGVTWSNGDGFTAQDVAHTITRWCKAEVPGNSMAVRLGALIDPDTMALRDGAVEVLGDLTLRLNLSYPDVTLIPSFADYPAAITHQGYDGGDILADPVGTGPFLPEDGYAPGRAAALVRRDGWWGTGLVGGPFLDRVEFVDLGPDPEDQTRALVFGDVDLLSETTGVFVEALDAQSFEKSQTPSAATFVLRARAATDFEGFKPYQNPEARQALALAIDPEALLEIGFAGQGQIAANHHVAPFQPDYAEVGAPRFAPREVPGLLSDAGIDGFPHRLVSVEGGWQADATRVVAAMLRDAGVLAEEVFLTAEEYWAGWTAHPLSITEWAHRPLGIQTLALAYSSTSAWNETGYANPDFDAKVTQALGILDAAERQSIMAELQSMLIDDAVIVQPVWRNRVRHARVPLVGAEAHPTGELHLYKLGFAA